MWFFLTSFRSSLSKVFGFCNTSVLETLMQHLDHQVWPCRNSPLSLSIYTHADKLDRPSGIFQTNKKQWSLLEKEYFFRWKYLNLLGFLFNRLCSICFACVKHCFAFKWNFSLFFWVFCLLSGIIKGIKAFLHTFFCTRLNLKKQKWKK